MGHIPALNRRRRTEDNVRLMADNSVDSINVHKEVWSPFDFDKKYLELAQFEKVVKELLSQRPTKRSEIRARKKKKTAKVIPSK
jgi:hypothetical protein